MKLIGNHHGSHEEHDPAREPSPAAVQKESETPPPAQKSPKPPVASPETPKKKRRGLRTLLIILAVVVLVVIAVIVGYTLWERPPEILPPTPAATQSQQPGTKTDPVNTADPNATPDPNAAENPQPTETMDPGLEPVVDMTGHRKEGVYTIMVVGLDVVSSNTDTIIIISFDTRNHKISLTNIPRDTVVNIYNTYAAKRINTVYPGAKASGHDPAAALMNAVRSMLGFDVDCYCIVNIWGVARVVDAIGGLWYDVPPGIEYVDYVQDLYINIPEGYQQLNGQQTVQLCRFRHGYAGGDIQRIGVQHDVLKALAKQTLSLGNISNLPELLQIFVEEVQTNMLTANVAWFVRQFMQCKAEDITFQTMPIGTGDLVNGISMVSVAPESWLQMINDNINPYVDDVQMYNLDLLVAGASFAYATNGTIAGGPDSFYCTECTAHNDGEPVAHYPGAHIFDEEGNRIGEEPEDPDEPTETGEPVETDEPGVTEAPVEPEDPGVTDEPAPTETPAEPEPPAPTEPVGGADEE
jgi:LCP family protein required for cell wall assembly